MISTATCDHSNCFHCKFPMGTKVVDSISGFRGSVSGYAKFMGCDEVEVLLCPPSVDNTFEPEIWISESRLEAAGN